VNLDPHNVQSGWVSLDLGELGTIERRDISSTDDLLGGGQYQVEGRAQLHIELSPYTLPVHVFPAS